MVSGTARAGEGWEEEPQLRNDGCGKNKDCKHSRTFVRNVKWWIQCDSFMFPRSTVSLNVVVFVTGEEEIQFTFSRESTNEDGNLCRRGSL